MCAHLLEIPLHEEDQESTRVVLVFDFLLGLVLCLVIVFGETYTIVVSRDVI